MPLGGLIPYPDEGRETERALQENLTPQALAFLLSSMQQAPDLAFGTVQNPTSLLAARKQGVFGGDRFQTLLALLRQRAAGLT